jgi:hypothetical protein
LIAFFPFFIFNEIMRISTSLWSKQCQLNVTGDLNQPCNGSVMVLLCVFMRNSENSSTFHHFFMSDSSGTESCESIAWGSPNGDSGESDSEFDGSEDDELFQQGVPAPAHWVDYKHAVPDGWRGDHWQSLNQFKQTNEEYKSVLDEEGFDADEVSSTLHGELRVSREEIAERCVLSEWQEITPMHCFSLLVTPMMLRQWTNATNNSITQYYMERPELPASYEVVKSDEMQAFIGVLFAMCLNPARNKRHYWSSEWQYEQIGIPTVFGLHRFRFIFKFFHLTIRDPARSQEDVLYYCRQFMDQSLTAARTYWKAPLFLSADEATIRLKHKYYPKGLRRRNPRKKHRSHILVYTLCNSKGTFVFNYEFATGPENQGRPLPPEGHYDVGLTGRPIIRITEPLFNRGHVVVLDSLYTGTELFLELMGHRVYCVGTCIKGRHNTPFHVATNKLKGERTAENEVEWDRKYNIDIVTMPGDCKPLKLPQRSIRGRYDFRFCGKLTAYLWKDTKACSMMSTIHDPQETGNACIC